MANIKSQQKRHKQNLERAARNKAIRSRVKTLIKKANHAIQNDEKNSEQKRNEAIKWIDKAQSSGILHKNNAGNKKSKLMKLKK